MTSLDISNNQIGSGWLAHKSVEGSRCLGNAIKENTTLKELNLSSNYFQAEDAQLLAGGLCANGAMTSLNISNNSLGGYMGKDVFGRPKWISDMTGIKALAAAIPECK